jgi:ribulose bisphosphate carboxylase small subunit
MTINTELSIGENFYFLSEKTKKITLGKVYKIDVEYREDGETKVIYWHKYNESVAFELINEKFCFASKEELIQSLLN